MTTFLMIAIVGLLLAMVGILQKQQRHLRADLESFKQVERLRQVI